MERRKRKLQNLISKKDVPIVDQLLFIEGMGDIFEEEIRKDFTKKKIEYLTTNSPSKFHTKKIEMNKKGESFKKPSFLIDENGNAKYKKEAANLARDEMEKLYTWEREEIESFDDLNFDNKISEESKIELEKEYSIEEISKAIRKTPNKACGPSSTPIILFKKFEELLAPLLCDIANNIAVTGVTSDFLLAGNINLIPKKKESQYFNDLRPITLLEIPRKIITKAFTERLKNVLVKEKIVDESQYCHPERKIHENVLTLQLLIKQSKDEKKDLHFLFIDFSKAFDRVSHIYISRILKEKNFGEKTVRFVNTFLKGFRKIDFNGYLSEEFSMQRGIPQGETISPFLFAIVLDPLLNKIRKNNEIKGIEIENELSVKSLAYADDLAYTARNKEDLSMMLKETKTYGKCSNALISSSKSEIISFVENERNVIEEIDGIKQATSNVRHLGFYNYT